MSLPPLHPLLTRPPPAWARLDAIALASASQLLHRTAQELSADFDFAKPIRLSRAPGRLDVMGGIADYTGSLVCEMPLARCTAVALQGRIDREIQLFSFNLLDEHKPFTLRIELGALAAATSETLRRDFTHPGRQWGAYILGPLFLLHDRGLINLADPQLRGFNLAILTDIPIGGGLASSAALEVACAMNFIEHFGIRERIKAMDLAALCQRAENQIAGAACGVMDQVTSLLGEKDHLVRLICQPHEFVAPLGLPIGVRVLGIHSGVRHSNCGPAYTRTRVAAFMGHRIILEQMRQIGRASGQDLAGDPLRGYLANLDPDDYKNLFRPHLPDLIKGGDFLEKYGPTLDPLTNVHPDQEYAVQHATDHHVLEGRRVKRFAEFISQASNLPPGPPRTGLLNKAGHLMYASHLSYGMDAMLGAPECDRLVELLKQSEPDGIYGARITGGGCGGTVAILANEGPKTDAALQALLSAYQQETTHVPTLITHSSPGAWHTPAITLSS